MLESTGMASSGHMLIGDQIDAIGLEFTSTTFARLPIDTDGQIVYSNHFIAAHGKAKDPPWPEDSPIRVKQIKSLTAKHKTARDLSSECFSGLFEDESNFPSSIAARKKVSARPPLYSILL